MYTAMSSAEHIVCWISVQCVYHVSQQYPLPPPPKFLHTTLGLKWGGGLYSNIWLVSTISPNKQVDAANYTTTYLKLSG